MSARRFRLTGTMLAAAGIAAVMSPLRAGADGAQSRTNAQYRTVTTDAFTIEVPVGWEVGRQTPWGSSEITPGKEVDAPEGSSMSSMTGPGLGRQSWQQLYDTSLFFITRGNRKRADMRATPFEVGKSRQGFETCSWTMVDAAGKPLQRHVILKHSNGNILALSVKLPPEASAASRRKLEAMFQRLHDSAIVK